MTDTEIGTAIHAYRDQNGVWPTTKQLRAALGGRAGNDRLAQILRAAKGEVPLPVVGQTRLVEAIETQIRAAFWAALRNSDDALVALPDIRRAVGEAVDRAERQFLVVEAEERRRLEERLRSVQRSLDSVTENVDAAKACARGT